MNERIPYVDLVAQHEELREELVAALDRVLSHGQFILGPEVEALEKALSERLGVADVVSCNSGTDALLLAFRLRGIGLGDEVITVSHSFVATGNAILLAGAKPVFVDIDERTMTIDVDAAVHAIGPRTRAIVPVHMNGFPCDIGPLVEATRGRDIAIIEDCAQAFGARRSGRSVGTHDLGCFSLHPLKTLSACGDGGFISVANSEDAAALRRLRNHGLTDRDHCDVLGVNSRLDALQAAFVRVKLGRIDAWLQRRRAHAHAYRTALASHVTLPPDEPDAVPTPSAFVVRHPQRDRLVAGCHERGVDAKVHYPIAIHQQPVFREFVSTPLPVTERVVDRIVSLPVSAELTDAQRAAVVTAVAQTVEELG